MLQQETSSYRRGVAPGLWNRLLLDHIEANTGSHHRHTAGHNTARNFSYNTDSVYGYIYTQTQMQTHAQMPMGFPGCASGKEPTC